jgi:hypothetical protein
MDAARDDRGGRCGVFVVFAARAAFDVAPMAGFFAGITDLPL